MDRSCIIAYNQDITCDGLILIPKEHKSLRKIIEVENYRNLLFMLRWYPDSVVIVDYSLLDFSSVTHFINIKRGAKESSWLLFLNEPEIHFLRHLLQLDSIISILLKHNSKSLIIDALMCVAEGEIYWRNYVEYKEI